MTEKETIDYITMTGKSPRTFDDYTNYFFLIFPTSFFAMGSATTYNYIKFNTGFPILFIYTAIYNYERQAKH